MNTERLHSIVIGVKAELDETQQGPLMQTLIQGLQAMGNIQPGQPPTGPQEQVASARRELLARLSAATSNRYTPVERQELEELGIDDVLGDSLSRQIERIMSANEITPSAAAQQLEEPANKSNRLDNACDQLLQSFEFFGVGSEQLEPGEFEIGFVIPRKAVDSAVAELGLELTKINRILGPFLELSTGSRPDVPVRAIGSSDFQVLLYGVPSAALMLSKALDYLAAAYQKVVAIREANQQLREAGVAEATLGAVGAEADRMMEIEIERLIPELLEEGQSELDPGRRREITIELREALNALAKRIDRGYIIGVRAGEFPPLDEEQEESEEDARTRRIVEQVLERQENLRYTNLSGEPILSLPEPVDEDADGIESN
jgi:hypothetical protein